MKTGYHNKKERGGTVHSPCSGQSVEQAVMNTVMDLGVSQFVDHWSDCYLVNGEHS